MLPLFDVTEWTGVLLLMLALATDAGPDDPELARRIRDGDREALRIFFDRYHGLLYGYLRRRGVGPAECEDLAQHAFITIWERRKDINPRKSLRAFLFKIAYNRALNHFRDTAKFTDESELHDRPSASAPSDQIEYNLMQETLQSVVESLPERRRAVFELCFLEELTYRETAEVLGISVKTVENQMGAALKTVRAAFEKYVNG